MTLNATETTFLTAAFYKFVDLPDYADRRAALLAFCEAHNVKGLILLAREGINSTIAGVPEDVHAVLAYLRQDPKLADLEHKESVSNKAPFHRMKVRLKKEIVTLGVDGISPTKRVGQYVKPEDWNDLISAPDVVVIDTRNDYEVEIGSFKGAVDPQIQSFSQLTDWVKHAKVLEAKNGQKPRVAMFCTGGIRCEKSTSLMLEHGFEDVYHLQGGILKYLELVPPEKSLWEGECFVFDERVSVGHGLTPGPHELCRACCHLAPKHQTCLSWASVAHGVMITPARFKRTAHGNDKNNGKLPRRAIPITLARHNAKKGWLPCYQLMHLFCILSDAARTPCAPDWRCCQAAYAVKFAKLRCHKNPKACWLSRPKALCQFWF
jgi:UPF0176 protein